MIIVYTFAEEDGVIFVSLSSGKLGGIKIDVARSFIENAETQLSNLVRY